MNDNLFGVRVPDAVIERLEGAADQQAEGVAVCTELLERLQEIEGVHGAHLMGPRQESVIAEIAAGSGLRDRRRPN